MRKLTIILFALSVVAAHGTAVAQESGDDDAAAEEVTQNDEAGEADSSSDSDESEDDAADSSADGGETEDVDETLYASADRPSFSAGTFVVPPGSVQFELGVDASSAEGGTVLTFPQLLIRAGVSEVAELRLGVPSYSVGFGVDDPGAGTTEFSLKVAGNITDDFSAGVLPYVRFFDYSDEAPGTRSSLGFLGLWAYSLSDSFGIFGNAGLAAIPGEEAPTVFELAVSLGASFAVTDAFSLYAETFMTQAEGDPNVGIGAGPSLAVFPWLSIDGYVAAGLAGDFADISGGVGVTVIQ